MSEKNDKETNYEELNGQAGKEKISGLLKGIHIGMMTTAAQDGSMSSRPMAVQSTPFDGALWFLTRASSEKVEEVEKDRHVTLTFTDSGDGKYIALKGVANVSQDKSKIHELWSPMYKAWFPGGETDPEISVLRVDVTEGDFWEASDLRLVRLARYVAAAVTGGAVPVGAAGHVRVS